uniref:AB hydrolase-1 domain-containing protein n=1 Tax=Streptomyces fradiae TaxID=1906 RepID=Q45RA5_STRFR|nr:hypothetical protein [Streptomyces fradiae]
MQPRPDRRIAAPVRQPSDRRSSAAASRLFSTASRWSRSCCCLSAGVSATVSCSSRFHTSSTCRRSTWLAAVGAMREARLSVGSGLRLTKPAFSRRWIVRVMVAASESSTLARDVWRCAPVSQRCVMTSSWPGYRPAVKDNQAEDMRQLLGRLGVAGPIRLVGHDIGGMVAFSYARLYPEQVHRLALIDLLVPGLGLEKAMNPATGGSFHFGLFMAREVPELLFQGNERAFFQWWFPHLSATPGVFTPEEIDATTASYRGHDALRSGFEHYRTLLEDAETNRAWADSGHRMEVPLLAVGGQHNAGARLADSLRPVAPHLRAAVIEGSGHFVPEERPDALLDVLTPFLV